MELIGASNGGNLGADTFVNIIVPANDNPYGTVYFQQSVYRVQEPLEGVYRANITVRRRYFTYLLTFSSGIMVLFKVFCTPTHVKPPFLSALPLFQRRSLWSLGDRVQHL